MPDVGEIIARLSPVGVASCMEHENQGLGGQVGDRAEVLRQGRMSSAPPQQIEGFVGRKPNSWKESMDVDVSPVVLVQRRRVLEGRTGFETTQLDEAGVDQRADEGGGLVRTDQYVDVGAGAAGVAQRCVQSETLDVENVDARTFGEDLHDMVGQLDADGRRDCLTGEAHWIIGFRARRLAVGEVLTLYTPDRRWAIEVTLSETRAIRFFAVNV